MWEVNDALWEKGFTALQKFVQREGHARPSIKGHKEDGFNLGTWVNDQRTARHNLEPKELSLLKSLPGWAWDANEFMWEQGFDALRRFSIREGHARPTKDHIEDGYRLGQWVNSNRSKRNTMPTERASRLESLPGWIWSATEFQWESAFAALQRFTEREGHSRPLKNTVKMESESESG